MVRRHPPSCPRVDVVKFVNIPRFFATWNAKCPIFFGNFTPKTSNDCLKNRALGFPGSLISLFRTFTTRDNFVRAPWIALVLCTRNSLVAGNMARWAPTSYKWSYNLYKQGYDPSYLFIRPFIGGPITPFITSGPTLYPGMVY